MKQNQIEPKAQEIRLLSLQKKSAQAKKQNPDKLAYQGCTSPNKIKSETEAPSDA